MRSGSATGELASLRVVDVTSGIAGAYCAKLFADAGADVVLVEPADGHPLRRWTCSSPLPDDADDGALFRYLRHGQRAIVADDPDDTLAALVADADIVLLERDGPLGDPTAFAQAHPALIVVAISPFGLDGPYADRPASELTVQAESGALGIRGRPERPPVQAGGQVTDWVTGAYAAVAALAAAGTASRSGRGELVDVSWAEVANITCTLFIDLFDKVAGRPDLAMAPLPRSFETPSVEPTLDGYVGFNTNTRQQFEDFLVLIDRPDLLVDPSWASLGIRMSRWDEWNAIVHEWTLRHTTAAIVEQAAMLRIPVAPVADAPTLLALDHVVQRGVFVDDPTGTFTMPRRPWMIDGELPPPPTSAPRMGEHTGSVEAHERTAAAVPSTPSEPGALPFTGLRVLDLTAWWAGPSMTGMFAMLGADVIHVESVKHPDGIRMAGGAFHGRPSWWELSGFFLAANTNKRGLTLDLASPAGRDLLLQLVADADLVVENFTPRVLESFDLGWDVIHRTNPRAVMVRMPAFGLDGPWRDRPGFAQTMEQMTGLAWLTGHIDDQPRIQRGPCDPNGGMHAAFAAMVALRQRDRTGVGRLVEAPMFDIAVAVAAEPVLEHTAYGNVLQRDGNRSHRAAPQGVYACAGTEQWLALSAITEAQWTSLVELLAADLSDVEWLSDVSLCDRRARRARHDELDEVIVRWAAARTLDVALDALLAVGVAAARIVDPRRTSDHPQFLARGFHEIVDHPVGGPLSTPTAPFRFASVATWVRSPAPTLGQHNDEILTALGCTPADIDQLTSTGVIGSTLATA